MINKRNLKYKVILLLVFSQSLCLAQLPGDEPNMDYAKAIEYFASKDYESCNRHLQLSKLTNQSNIEDVVVLEIQCLFHLRKFKTCSEQIKYSISNINLSINSLNTISGIELKIKKYNDKKDIEVAKLRMIDKVKSEPSTWSSFINSAKSSIKTIISN